MCVLFPTQGIRGSDNSRLTESKERNIPMSKSIINDFQRKMKRRFLQSLAKHVFLSKEWSGLADAKEFFHSYLEYKDEEKWIMTEICGKNKIYIDLMDCGVSRHVLFSTYEEKETNLIREHLKPGSVFIDIGANIGWYTIQASKWVGEKGIVMAFEPRPSTFQYLLKSVQENALRNVRLFNIALSNASGRGNLMKVDGQRNTGGSYLGTGKGVEVPLKTLDELTEDLDRLDMIKMDVEGWEPMVIEGAKKTIEKYKPIIVSEISSEFLSERASLSASTFIQSVNALGYRCYDIETMNEIVISLKEKLQINAIFFPL